MTELPIINLLPERYRPYCAAFILALPYLTRAYHALRAGGGLRGVWRGIWFGTNLPD